MRRAVPLMIAGGSLDQAVRPQQNLSLSLANDQFPAFRRQLVCCGTFVVNLSGEHITCALFKVSLFSRSCVYLRDGSLVHVCPILFAVRIPSRLFIVRPLPFIHSGPSY